jgi:hypothetical protein
MPSWADVHAQANRRTRAHNADRVIQFISQFLTENRTATTATVEQAFQGTGRATRPSGEKSQPSKRHRRTASEILVVRYRLLRAVRENSSATMEDFASKLGEESSVPHRYASTLKEQGLIRTVGTTSYFPMDRSVLRKG